MRWIVLTLSLGAAAFSMIHGVIARLLAAQPMPGVPMEMPGGAFTLLTLILLIVSAVFALLGGYWVFNRRRVGAILLAFAAVICFFAHHDTRVYSGIYLAGCVFSLFVRRSSHYGEEDEDGYSDEEEGEENQEYDNLFPRDDIEEKDSGEDLRTFSYGGRRRERAAKIKENKEEYGFSREFASKRSEPVRTRSSKVCPACGASVGIEHKFCHTCGGALAISSQFIQTENIEVPLPTSSVLDEPSSFSANSSEKSFDSFDQPAPVDKKDRPRQEISSVFGGGLQTIFPADSLSEIGTADEEPWESSEDDEPDRESEREREISVPHRVFIKPEKAEQPVPKRPFAVSPDNSYQDFSNYTRRRKRKNNSPLRRIFGVLVLLIAVGGASWFLLSLRKVPPPPQPDPNPIIEPIPDPTPIPIDPRPDPFELRIEILAPARGAVLGSNVNVRSDHSTAGQVVTRLNTDTKAELLERWEGGSGNLTEPWYRIRTSGREGWIYSQYFQLLDARETTLPAGYVTFLLSPFGADKTELIARLGQPTRQTATTLTWTGLVANLGNNNTFSRLQITGARHTLRNEVAVGMTADALYRIMGYPSDYKGGQLRYLETANLGVSVRLQSGKIQSLTVGSI